MSASTARIEARVAPETKARIEHAAELEHVSVSEFVLAAASERADSVMRRHESYTTVPEDFFDRLIDALDEPAAPDPSIVDAISRSRARAARF